ncbi:hypothetical protein SPAN111604_06050 [Sphingomonas antarctica]|uniref:hypothetical protein n=1 Tax=Sphingomonas antarctica TaxID=2040274 RepID=UPI0039EC5BEB
MREADEPNERELDLYYKLEAWTKAAIEVVDLVYKITAIAVLLSVVTYAARIRPLFEIHLMVFALIGCISVLSLAIPLRIASIMNAHRAALFTVRGRVIFLLSAAVVIFYVSGIANGAPVIAEKLADAVHPEVGKAGH